MNWLLSNMLDRLILSSCFWDLICHLRVKTLKLKLESFEGWLLKRVDMVFLLRFFESFIKGCMALFLDHFPVLISMFTLVSEPTAMDDIPGILLILLLYLELVLFGGSLSGNLLKVDGEGVSTGLEGTHAEVSLRDHISLLLLLHSRFLLLLLLFSFLLLGSAPMDMLLLSVLRHRLLLFLHLLFLGKVERL